jgi:aminotransferase
MKEMIPIFSNSLNAEELQQIESVFKSRWTGFGDKTKEFESKFGEKVGAQNCIMLNSASAAALVALKSLNIGPGDEVIIPTINFIGCSNSIIEVGATPVFADVDTKYFNILPGEITRLKTARTKAVLLLHYGGHACNMDIVYEESRGLLIIEDSANSLVSKYKGRNCGTLGDAGFYSFDSMKILTTGDGGALVLKDGEITQRAEAFRFLGLNPRETSGTDSLRERKEKWWEIDLQVVSNRYLMNDIAASIGLVQLEKLDKFINRRKEIWEIYQKEFAAISWLEIPPEPLPNTETTYYLYWLRFNNGRRTEFAHYLVNNGIYCTFRYYPLHLIKLYGSNVRLKNSEMILDTAINIPLQQNLTDEQVKKIIDCVKKFK